MLIDSHCHINYKDYDEDRGDVLEKAKRVGVKKFILINTHIKDALDLQKIAQDYEDVFYTIGNHPSDAYVTPTLHDELSALCRPVRHPEPQAKDPETALKLDPSTSLGMTETVEKLVGIGETGLDFYYDNVDRSVQQESFAIHIDVANHFDLPLVVHTRSAEQETLDLIKKANKGVLHCFTSSYDMAKKALDLGFYISLSGILTFKNASELRETAKKLPLDRILVETDAPYLTPEPYRHIKRNEPAYVYYTAKLLAEIKEMDFDAVCEQTTKNCLTLFSKMT